MSGSIFRVLGDTAIGLQVLETGHCNMDDGAGGLVMLRRKVMMCR
jgi:hypothetical protein